MRPQNHRPGSDPTSLGNILLDTKTLNPDQLQLALQLQRQRREEMEQAALAAVPPAWRWGVRLGLAVVGFVVASAVQALLAANVCGGGP